MAILSLEPPPASPDRSGLGELLDGVVAGLTAAAEVSPTTMTDQSLTDQDLAGAVTVLASIESRATALRLALSAEADRRQVAKATAETGTDAWVARLTGSTRAQAAGGLRLARLLADKYPATRAAFAAGALRVEQVRVICNAAEQAPAEATTAQVAAAEEWLVAKATGEGNRGGRPMDAARLRQTARRMFAPLDHDLADRHEAILLGRESRTAEAETYLALHNNGNGTYSGRFQIPELQGQILTQALDQLTAPRRLNRTKNGDTVIDPTAAGTDNGVPRYHAHGAALCELIEHLPTQGWPGHGGTNTEVIVTLSHDTLRTSLGMARLDGGVAITPSQARRLACNAGIIPAVLDSDSQPLNLGRTRRLHTKTQRRALALLYDTCAIVGCQRPFTWTEIHHPHWWSRGGNTNLDNALPLCGHHHQRAHDTHFDLRRRPDGDWTYHRRT
jgi:hypothetical protein